MPRDARKSPATDIQPVDDKQINRLVTKAVKGSVPAGTNVLLFFINPSGKKFNVPATGSIQELKSVARLQILAGAMPA